MYAKKGILAAVIIFVTVGICSAQTVKQDFSISGKLTDENTRFDVAVSSKTGNVMVAWERLTTIKGEWAIDGIYYVFAKRKPNGKYRILKAKYLHEGEWIKRDWVGDTVRDGFQFPDIEYNPANNTFLTVYSSSTFNKTYARVVNENGKKTGDEVWVWPDDENPPGSQKDMTDAKIAYIPNSPAPGQFRIFYRHDGRHSLKSWSEKPTGTFTGKVDAQGNYLGPEPKKPVFEHLYGQATAGSIRCINSTVGGIQYVKDGGVLVGYSKPYWDAGNQRGYSFAGWAAKLNKKGNLVTTKKVGGDNSGGAECIAPLSSNRFLFVWEGDWTKEACQGNNHINSIFNPKLKQKGKSKEVLPGANCSSAWAVKLGQDRGSFQVYKPSSESAFYGYYLSPSGKIISNNKLMDFESFYGMVQMVAIPGTDEVFVVWLKSDDQLGLSRNEIRGFVADALN